jgi:predicted unusual protein kinase regulating ubiquinone biosynthesis (AarF/ABC1/UbiB family)
LAALARLDRGRGSASVATHPKSAGISGDAKARQDEMLALTAGVTRTIGLARIRGLLRSKKGKEELRQAALEKATQQAVEQLGAMKGLSMKIGQMMSYLNVLSEEGEESLSGLQAAVPPMAPGLAAAVIEEELGAPPNKVFAKFSAEPMAAASVGQVHRARLHDGREVAVKIQYPGVDDAFRADIANLEAMVPLATMTMKADLTEYMGLLSNSFMAELDYRLEQQNQQRLADLFRGHRFVLIPETVPELCSARVLVTEFVEGDRLQTVAKTRDQADRDRVAEIMYRFAYGCVMYGLFSGDPHPGNYVFPDDGRVCFLDFGMVLDLRESGDRSKLAEIVAGALSGRQDLIDDGLRAIGSLPEGGPSGAAVWAELAPLVVGPIDADQPARLDRDVFRSAMMKASGPRSDLNRSSMKTEHFEAWAAISMRYVAGSLAAIAKFSPELPWRQIIAEIVLGAPAETPIGKEWGDAPGGAAFAGSRYEIGPPGPTSPL